jgi:glycosyltransferase involved in cell wall biosynthesis
VRILIAIPVYNEARYVASVLGAVQQHGHDILVINDGSTDATANELRRFPQVAVIEHLENRGYGQSLIDAFAYAHREGYDWVITMDCDEQHEPALIPEFVQAARQNRDDVISGSRYLQPDPEDDIAPADRRRINHTVNDLLEQVLDLRVTDSFCGFKAHRVSAMARLQLDEPGYAFPCNSGSQPGEQSCGFERSPSRESIAIRAASSAARSMIRPHVCNIT